MSNSQPSPPVGTGDPVPASVMPVEVGAGDALVHYAQHPVGGVYSVEQLPIAHFKPRGFWLSVDSCEDNWRTWCEGARSFLERLTQAHDITLAPGARILRITNVAELDAFDAEFGVTEHRCLSYVKWWDVARRHQGIIIAPDIWQRRLSDIAQWYYSWDCASGCIWDARAIASVTLRHQGEKTTHEPRLTEQSQR